MGISREPSFPVAALAAIVVTLIAAGCADGPAGRPDVILVTLDTTRLDRLGVYGHDRPVSPHLDAFATGADRYTRAYASSSWTLPTHASILTGLHATDHGAHLGAAGGTAHRMREDVATLAARLGEHGYASAAIVGAHTLNRRFGLGRGFDRYDAPEGEDVLASRSAEILTDLALEWLDEQEGDPVFLFVNYFDPHVPYRPPDPCHQRLAAGVPPHGDRPAAWHRRPMEENLALYDAEICFMDQEFGRLMEGLRARGRLEGALVVVVADHGERFDPALGMVHGRTLREPLIRVPLLVKRPQQQTGNVIEETFEARSLYRLMLAASGETDTDPRPGDPFGGDLIVSELWRGGPEQGDPVLRALVRWPLKLVAPPGGPAALYDLDDPAGETVNVAPQRPDELADLEALLAAWVASRATAAGTPVEIDPALRERLRSLGYAF